MNGRLKKSIYPFEKFLAHARKEKIFLNEKKFPKIEIERRPETGKRNLTTKLQNCFLKINWSLKLTPRPGDSPIKILSIPIG